MRTNRLLIFGSSKVWFAFFLTFAVTACTGALRSAEGAESADSQPSAHKSVVAAKVLAGPTITDFNSEGLKISKVVRIERSLNALGVAGQFGKTNKVGKYVELPKRLEPSQRGEQFVLTWKCAGKSPPNKAELRFEYKLSAEEHLQTITQEYSKPRKGSYRLVIDHTGESYRRRGRIEYWRVVILADGKLVARKEAFLWPVFRGEGSRAERGA